MKKRFPLWVPASSRGRWLLVTLLGLALFLRVRGLDWGLPNELHAYSYHPDEWSLVTPAVFHLHLRGDLNPHFFRYGTLSIYLLGGVIGLARWLGLVALPGADLGFLYWLARLISVGLGVLTVYLTYVLGAHLYGHRIGLGGALLLSLTPLHVVHSHYATVDVPLTFWTTLALIAAARLALAPATPRRAVLFWHLFAGAAAGLSASTKYVGGLVFLPVLAASVMGARATGAGIFQPAPPAKPPGRVGWLLLWALLAAGGGFLLGTPYALLSPQEFWDGFAKEMWQHPQQAVNPAFWATGPGWWYYLRVGMPAGLGLGLTVGSLVGGGLAVKRASWADQLLWAWCGPFYLAMGAAQDHYLRYLMPLLPVLTLWTARGLVEAWSHSGPWRTVGWGAGVFLLGSCALKTGAYVHLLCAPDARDEVARWFRQEAPAGSTVGLVEKPWFHTPPLDPFPGDSPGRTRFSPADPAYRYRYQILGRDAAQLMAIKPPWLVFSDLVDLGDYLRMGSEQALTFRQAVEANYQLRLHRRNRPRFLGLTWDRGPVPHDWRYLNPEIWVYQARGNSDPATR